MKKKKYIVNKNTKQIHYTPAMQPRCNIDERKPHFYRCGEIRRWLLLKFCGYDGCGICMPWDSKNNG